MPSGVARGMRKEQLVVAGAARTDAELRGAEGVKESLQDILGGVYQLHHDNERLHSATAAAVHTARVDAEVKTAAHVEMTTAAEMMSVEATAETASAGLALDGPQRVAMPNPDTHAQDADDGDSSGDSGGNDDEEEGDYCELRSVAMDHADDTQSAALALVAMLGGEAPLMAGPSPF